MKPCYALEGGKSKSLLSWRGLVIVHESREELEWIIKGDVRIVRCPDYVQLHERVQLRDHPDFASYRWPLRKEDFRR